LRSPPTATAGTVALPVASPVNWSTCPYPMPIATRVRHHHTTISTIICAYQAKRGFIKRFSAQDIETQSATNKPEGGSVRVFSDRSKCSVLNGKSLRAVERNSV
ncbi:unnamed protein product, partial [Pleuronectes platessa]